MKKMGQNRIVIACELTAVLLSTAGCADSLFSGQPEREGPKAGSVYVAPSAEQVVPPKDIPTWIGDQASTGISSSGANGGVSSAPVVISSVPVNDPWLTALKAVQAAVANGGFATSGTNSGTNPSTGANTGANSGTTGSGGSNTGTNGSTNPPQVGTNTGSNSGNPNVNTGTNTGTNTVPKQPIDRPLKLTLVQRNYESWWKNCLSVGVYNNAGTLLDSANIGCNKDANAVGRSVDLKAAPWPECNRIRVYVATFKNQGSTCSDNKGAVCMGPYSSIRDWLRSSSDSPLFFKSYDARSAAQHDSRIVYQFDWASLEQGAAAYRNGGANRWLVSFYEDQSFLTGAGVDFNDFIFDLKGEGVKFTIDGSAITCESQ